MKRDDLMIDAIEIRRSVRTYVKEVLTDIEKKAIQDILKKSEQKIGIFGHQAKFFFVNSMESMDDIAKKIGTYGFVKNAPAFFGGVIKNEFKAIVDFGYLFEQIILEFTKMELGTVWLGGTFDRKAFSAEVGEGEVIPAISPVGHAYESMSIKERSIRMFIRANQRKLFRELFFDTDISHPITDDKKSEYALSKYLELVQIGPSASNKQPWRIILDGKKAHFYLKKTENYAQSIPFDIQALDMGIALCHYEEGLKEDHKEYQFIDDELSPVVADLIYIQTIEIK
jgi:hypothetical protein